MIAPDGKSYIAVSATLSLVLLAASFFVQSWLVTTLAILAILLTINLLFFFRDPERNPPHVPDSLLSPADGRILALENVDDNSFVGAPTQRLSIFLSLFDVHINRAPASGTIDSVSHRSGRFLPAFSKKSVEQNEQTEVRQTLVNGERIIFRQIAGTIARRIVTSVRENDSVPAGSRIGMIKFGSRTDLLCSMNYEFTVSQGQHVKAGLTVIAKMKSV